MAEEKIKVAADVCSYVDPEHSILKLEVSLPGVKKKDIRLTMHDDSFSLVALRDNFDYVTTFAFCCPVKADKTSAFYEDGLLKIDAPFKDPMENAVDVLIN